MSLAYEIEAIIDRMALTVRTIKDTPGLSPPQGRWWVLVCGEEFNPLDFDQREEAREALRHQAALSGVQPGEYVWVWDDRNRAQLVAGRFADHDRAAAYARRLAQRGLSPRLMEAWDD